MRSRLEIINERIAHACVSAGRAPEDVTLMAVSKRQPDERISDALAQGLRLFGESLVQETRDRIGMFPEEARVHLIGHLQRNKAKDAARLYHAIQSIDSTRTLDALAPHLVAGGLDLFIEVNSSGEASKYGVSDFDEILPLVERIMSTRMMRFRGLMTIGPFTDSEEPIRRAFALLRGYRDRLEERYPELGRLDLSMGMSDDLEYAIAEGSTMVRIGTALFGPRTR